MGIPTTKTWTNKFHQGRIEIGLWHNRVSDKSKVKNYGYEQNTRGEIVGIRYEEVETITNKSDEDYLEFIAKISSGITPLGLKLVQQSIESYVYCILGAQVNTRWAIVGLGAKSLKTQDVFRKLVKDTIAQDDVTVAISNMLRAIRDTNVVLDMAVSPGLMLVPSNMIIQTQMRPGYNNTLTIATKTGLR